MNADTGEPLILIDGVLNVVTTAKRRRHLAYHEGWIQKRVDVGGLNFRLFVNPATGSWLRKLAAEIGGLSTSTAATRCALPDLPVAVTLACGHDRALAQLSRDGRSAWCYVCERAVRVNDSAPAAAVRETEGS